MVICWQKKVAQWLWWVRDSSNRQIVDFTIGRKTNATFRRLEKMLIGAGVSVKS
jgi:IS1 family transposase